jgi:signal transduction histidine kinase/CheY-like chemotaxis protein
LNSSEANEPQALSPADHEAEIFRLVGAARERGRPDVCVGRRRWTRYCLGMSLELTTDPDTPGASQVVRMHNISGGGVGFWSPQELGRGTRICVRESAEGELGIWLAGRVTYCALGMGGYLIGMTFDHPAPPDVGMPPPSSLAQSSGKANTTRLGRCCCSVLLPTQCAVACVVCVAFGVGTAWLLQSPGARFFSDATYNWVLALVSATIGAALLGKSLVGCRVAVLDAIQKAVQSMARGDPIVGPLPDARSKELRGLRQAILDLGSRWRSRDNDERVQRQKLEELNRIRSNILSTVSHDLRTPLTSILLYSRMLNEDLSRLTEEDQRHFLGIISDECTRLSRLVDDLLEVQRLEAGKDVLTLRPHDLAETVRACAAVFDPIAGSASIRFAVECPRSLPQAQVDPDKIAQVLNNLLSNAMKYTPAGGSVRLIAEVYEGDIQFRVRDDGPGIPRDKWDQVFDRFTQLSTAKVREISGVGLGLYIVRQIVEKHGGTVWVNSEVGEGSEFCVMLPLQQDGEGDDCTSPDAPPAGSVLVCDADPELAAAIARVFRRRRLALRVVHSASRLIEVASHGGLDVVLTDLLLPDANSAELLEKLLAMGDRCFRLIVHSYEGNVQELRRRGVGAFLRRPASEQELVLAVLIALHRRSAANKVAVLVRSKGLDPARMEQAFTCAGYLVIPAGDLSAAARISRQNSVEFVLTCGEDLGLGWGDLRVLSGGEGLPTTGVVLCEDVGKDQRRLAEQHGVVVLPYRPGEEEQVVTELSTLDASDSLERQDEADTCLRR